MAFLRYMLCYVALIYLLLVLIILIDLLASTGRKQKYIVVIFISKLHELVNLQDNLHGTRAENSVLEDVSKF